MGRRVLTNGNARYFIIVLRANGDQILRQSEQYGVVVPLRWERIKCLDEVSGFARECHQLAFPGTYQPMPVRGCMDGGQGTDVCTGLKAEINTFIRAPKTYTVTLGRAHGDDTVIHLKSDGSDILFK